MKLQLYVKQNVIGLCFTSQIDRDTFWSRLGDFQTCSERFGERTVRFNPAKAAGSFSIPLEVETLRVIVDKAVPVVAKPAPPVEIPVMPTAPAPIPPVAILPGLDQAVLVVEPAATIPATPTMTEPAMTFAPPASPPIAIPQVSSVTEAPQPPKPPDMRSRAGREWKRQQQAVK